MANKKRRCTNCKKYKITNTGIVAAIGFFCDNNCRYKYATTKTKSLLVKSKKIETVKQDKIHSENKRKLKVHKQRYTSDKDPKTREWWSKNLTRLGRTILQSSCKGLLRPPTGPFGP